MKAIATVAILKALTTGQTTAAGIFVASYIFFFRITGLWTRFTALIPIPVVKGIQVGAGLSLHLCGDQDSFASLMDWANME